jgi:hypothetical protein
MRNSLYEEYCFAKNNEDFVTIERLYFENKYSIEIKPLLSIFLNYLED